MTDSVDSSTATPHPGRDGLARTLWNVDHPDGTRFEDGGVWVETAYELADAARAWFAAQGTPPTDEDDAPVRWAVPCGCDAHGDHGACERNPCHKYLGCVHPIGMEITSATEEEADARARQPVPTPADPAVTGDRVLDQLVTRAQDAMGADRLPRWQTQAVLLGALGTHTPH